MTKIGISIVKTILAVLPANTLASLIAEYVTMALQRIKDKERMASISLAVTATSSAVGVVAESIHDCEITEEEVDRVSDKIEAAVAAIIAAAK